MPIIHYYRETEPSHSLLPSIQESLQNLGLTEDAAKITSIATESCFNVQLANDDGLSTTSRQRLEWLLAETFDRSGLRLEKSVFDEKTSASSGGTGTTTYAVEFGPRMTFTSAFSSNAVSICTACGLTEISRLELSKRYQFHISAELSPAALKVIKAMLHDRMTEEEYVQPIESFESGAITKEVVTVPITEEGRAALERINESMGLGFDDFDLDYYTNLFKVCISMCRCAMLWNGWDVM